MPTQGQDNKNKETWSKKDQQAGQTQKNSSTTYPSQDSAKEDRNARTSDSRSTGMDKKSSI